MRSRGIDAHQPGSGFVLCCSTNGSADFCAIEEKEKRNGNNDRHSHWYQLLLAHADQTEINRTFKQKMIYRLRPVTNQHHHAIDQNHAKRKGDKTL